MPKHTRQHSDDELASGTGGLKQSKRAGTKTYRSAHKRQKLTPVVHIETHTSSSSPAPAPARAPRSASRVAVAQSTAGPAAADVPEDSSGSDDEVEEYLIRTRSSMKRPAVGKTPEKTKSRAAAVKAASPKSSSRHGQVPTPPKSAQRQPPKTPTKTKSPSKARQTPSQRDTDALPRTPSPHKQQQARATPTSLSAKSDRQRGLPPDRSAIMAAPPMLISRLVGAHMDLPSYKLPTPPGPSTADEAESEDASDLEVENRPERAIESEPASKKSKHIRHSRQYPASNVLSLFADVNGSLAGSILPTVGRPGDSADVMAWPYLDEQYRKWEQPMRYAAKSVIQDGTGNCLMLIGARGVGKTMITERCLFILDQVYGRDQYIPVRLNGLVHTTDRMALRSIAWQLKSHGFEEFDGDWSSNAATMTTLLRMLEPATDPNSVAEKPVIIVLDEFDLFALHPRQSFLYCLLDIVQGNRRKAGMGVFGLSSRTDCLAILEKRVRSRCQSQVHHMVLNNNYSDYIKLAKSLLSVAAVEGGERQALLREWNEEVQAFIDDNAVQDYLRRQWVTFGNTPTQLRLALTHVIHKAEAQARRAILTNGDQTTVELPTFDVAELPVEAAAASRDDLALNQLNILELTVCIAAKHMRTMHDNTINLEMLYRCYSEHVGRGKIHVSTKPFSRSAFIMAFDRLRAQQLFLPHLGKLSSHVTPSEANPHKTFRFVPWDTTIDEALKKRSDLRKDVPEHLKKWCKDWTA
ncbi:origin recognition complex subunit 4 [Microbotryomycetes sp. JL201]|nr:origin recognition complex subunit 4 [Microbotryomycetes sp. JL201]